MGADGWALLEVEGKNVCFSSLAKNSGTSDSQEVADVPWYLLRILLEGRSSKEPERQPL